MVELAASSTPSRAWRGADRRQKTQQSNLSSLVSHVDSLIYGTACWLTVRPWGMVICTGLL